MKGQYEPVMDDSGRITKYIKGTVSISCYLFPGCFDGYTSEGGESVLPYNRASSVNDISTSTTDDELSTLRQRLTEPCQQLKIQYQGFGNIDINNPLGVVRDVNNGPKPKVTRWTPYTNKAAFVEWEVEFCYSPCQSTLNGAFTSGGNRKYCQWPYEVEFSLDEKGLTTYTITGRVEIALTRDPTVNAQAGASSQFNVIDIEKDIVSVFPRMKGFKRTKQSFKISNDRKFVNFTIQDQELNSQEAFGVGIADNDVTLSTSSGFDKGFFTKWMTSLSGKIELYPGYDKTYAYAEAARLFDRYCRSACIKGRLPDRTDSPDYDVNKNPDVANRSRAILREIKYSDNIFDRSISFSYVWELFVKPQDLFLATGMFLPVEPTNQKRNDRWTYWMLSGTHALDEGGYQQMTLSNNSDIVVSLCNPWFGPRPTTPVTPPQTNKYDNTDPTYNKTPGKKENTYQYNLNDQTAGAFYSVFKNMYVTGQLLNTVPHIPLWSLPAVQETVPNLDKMKETGKLNLNTNTDSTSTSSGTEARKKVLIHKYGPTTTTVTMVGYAERLGNIPQVPQVESMSGKKVIPYGATKYIPIHNGFGIDVLSGINYGVHGLFWQKSYIVLEEPSDISFKTSGQPAAFTV